MRGPVVYCAEAVDNDFPLNNIVFGKELNYKTVKSDQLDAYMLDVDIKIPQSIDDLYTFTPFKYRKKTLRMIPYYCFANRGETEMRVWL
jgi:hypothetical protein